MNVKSWNGTHIIIVPADGEQVRRHHKRRINKKWLKRYGVYHTKMKDDLIVVSTGIYGVQYVIMTRNTFNKVRNCEEWKKDLKVVEIDRRK